VYKVQLTGWIQRGRPGRWPQSGPLDPAAWILRFSLGFVPYLWGVGHVVPAIPHTRARGGPDKILGCKRGNHWCCAGTSHEGPLDEFAPVLLNLLAQILS